MNTDRDVKAYEDFRGFAPDEIVEDYLPDEDVSGWHMGDVDGIAYTTFRDNETQRYYHKFKKKAAPSLIAAEDGKQLYLTGGNYRVTDRGIEDNKLMPALLVANPHKRGTRKKKVNPMALFKRRRKRRTAARHVVRANPIRRRRKTSHRRRAVVVHANPVRRLRRRRKSYARNPIARVHTRRAVSRRRRRNPIGLGGKGSLDIKALIMPAIMQGAGAVATSIAVGYLPLPANLKSGSMLGLTKAVTGLAIGWVVAKFINKRLGQNFAEGALTVAAYDAINGVATNAGVSMSAMYPGMGAMYHPGMGWTTGASVSNDYAAAYH